MKELRRADNGWIFLFYIEVLNRLITPWLFISVLPYNLKSKTPFSLIADSRGTIGSSFFEDCDLGGEAGPRQDHSINQDKVLAW